MGRPASSLAPAPPPCLPTHPACPLPSLPPCPCAFTPLRARTKRIAGIKNLDIYALALFVDQQAVRSQLHAKFGGASADALARSQALFDGERVTVGGGGGGACPGSWARSSTALQRMPLRLAAPAAALCCPAGHAHSTCCTDALLPVAELVAHEGVEKTLRIVITSGLVKRKAFLEALEERLEPPLKQVGA